MAHIVVVGEILWDCLPSGPCLGGAPLNVAANLALLGHEATLVSAVGKDEFGDKALEALEAYGVKTNQVRRLEYPTGTVEVSLDKQGDASYRFTPDCAWHHIGESMAKQDLPPGDALVYGSLANHTAGNWNWLKDQIPRFQGLRFCDINLREPWDLELVKSIATTANILKCNESEYGLLTGIPAAIEFTGMLRKAKEQLPSFPDNLCVTFGEEGALYFGENEEVYCGAVQEVEVVDSVGAGDAFMAGLIHQLLKTDELDEDEFLNFCCDLGAQAASRPGALPDPEH